MSKVICVISSGCSRIFCKGRGHDTIFAHFFKNPNKIKKVSSFQLAQLIRSRICTHCATHSILGSSPTNACTWIKMAYLSCWLLRGVTSEVNLRNLLRGSSEACEGSTLALKPCADVTRRLKQGYQWSHKRINVLQNIFKKGSLVPRPGVRKLYRVLLSYYVWNIFRYMNSKKYNLSLI